MAETKKNMNSFIPARKWRDLSEEMLKDPDAYYAEARERAEKTAQKTLRERGGMNIFGRGHRTA
jgi:hypothetical protein